MSTIKSYATERHWCLYCPDLIVHGEVQITDPAMKDPLGADGFAHADCAEDNGWVANEDHTDGQDEPEIREALRRHIRTHGPIELS